MPKIKHDEEDEYKESSCNYCLGNTLGYWNGDEYEECPYCEYKDNGLEGGFMPDGFSEGFIFDDPNEE